MDICYLAERFKQFFANASIIPLQLTIERP